MRLEDAVLAGSTLSQARAGGEVFATDRSARPHVLGRLPPCPQSACIWAPGALRIFGGHRRGPRGPEA